MPDDLTPPAQGAPYRTTVADPVADGEKILALWRSGLGHHGAPQAKLDWFYRHNPEGSPLVVLLHLASAPDAIGVGAVGPRRMQFGSEILRAGALVDFVMLPEYRTFFPAIFLQQEVRRRAVDHFSIVFGFPNKKALPIVRRVGYQCVGQMIRRTRVLRSTAYLTKYLPGWLSGIAGFAIDAYRSTKMSVRSLVNGGFKFDWQDRPDDSFDDLWRRAATPTVLMGVRDRAFLAWRFVDAPTKSYKFFKLLTATDLSLVAYAVCEVEGAVMTVADFLVDPKVETAAARLWLDLSREATRMGLASLSVMFLGAEKEQRVMSAAGLLDRGQDPVYASMSPPPGVDDDMPLKTSAWYLTSADEDG